MLGAMLLRRVVSTFFSLSPRRVRLDSLIEQAAFLSFWLTLLATPGFPTDMTVPVTKMWEHTGGVMPRTLVPAQRMGAEEEMAGTVLYLASRAGGYCNGNVQLVDGGFLANHAGTY